jgi:hypothetical protein
MPTMPVLREAVDGYVPSFARLYCLQTCEVLCILRAETQAGNYFSMNHTRMRMDYTYKYRVLIQKVVINLHKCIRTESYCTLSTCANRFLEYGFMFGNSESH